MNPLQNKYDLLNKQFEGRIDIFVISETKLNNLTNYGQAGIPRTIFWKDRNSFGGGLMDFIKYDIHSKLLSI